MVLSTCFWQNSVLDTDGGWCGCSNSMGTGTKTRVLGLCVYIFITGFVASYSIWPCCLMLNMSSSNVVHWPAHESRVAGRQRRIHCNYHAKTGRLAQDQGFADQHWRIQEIETSVLKRMWDFFANTWIFNCLGNLVRRHACRSIFAIFL